MKSFTSVLVAGFAALAQAVQLTNSDFNIQAGQPFEITWSDAQGPVTLNLKNGPSTDLKTVSVIASGQTGTSFTWTPSTTLPTDQYAIEITDSSGTPNYSGQFNLVTSVTASASVSTTAVSSAVSTTVISTITSSASVSSSAETSAVTSAANSTTVASTVSTSTRASTRTSSTTGSTTSTTTVPGEAGRIGSPIALIGLTIAAMLYFQ
ncbi:hypothetical protein EsH8_I_001108 [Colletotrichum jinshuiense]